MTCSCEKRRMVVWSSQMMDLKADQWIKRDVSGQVIETSSGCKREYPLRAPDGFYGVSDPDYGSDARGSGWHVRYGFAWLCYQTQPAVPDPEPQD